MIKVAVLTPFYYPSTGGAQEDLRLFSEYFISQGCAVRVFTSQQQTLDDLRIFEPRSIEKFSPFEIKDKIEITRYPYGGWLNSFYGVAYAISYRLHLFCETYFFNLYQGQAMRLGRAVPDILTFNPDVVLVTPGIECLMDACQKIKAKSSTKIIMKTSLHLEVMSACEAERTVRKLAVADAVLVNTAHEKGYIVSQGISEQKVFELGVAVDVDRYLSVDESLADAKVRACLEGKQYILYFGRKQSLKGMRELVEAVGSLQKQYPNLYLVLAGVETSYFFQEIEPLIKGKENIFSFGYQDEATRKWLFTHCLAFSMVSRIDSFGIVYCESWLTGRPVIGADTSQTRNVICDGVDGFLVPYGQAAALADKLRIFLEDPTLADRMGEAGRQKTIALFSNRLVEKKVYHLLTTLLKK